MRDVPPRSAEHNCDASADHATDVTAEKSDEGASSAVFDLGSFSWSGCALHLARASTKGSAGGLGVRLSLLGVEAGAAFFPPPPHHDVRFGGGGGADASSSESEASPGSSSGLGKRHTTTSPFDVPAARFTDVPEDATASEVTAPFFTSSVRFPSNAPATRTDDQYRRSASDAARCAATGAGARPSSPSSPPRTSAEAAPSPSPPRAPTPPGVSVPPSRAVSPPWPRRRIRPCPTPCPTNPCLTNPSSPRRRRQPPPPERPGPPPAEETPHGGAACDETPVPGVDAAASR